MAYNPNFDVTQINKGLPGLRGPKSAVPTAAPQSPAESAAPAVEEAAILPENPQDEVVLGQSTETVVVATPAAPPATVPPQVEELKEQIRNLGSHEDDLLGRLQTAVSAIESGDTARGMKMLEAIQTYLELREDIRSATGLNQNTRTSLQQKAWQEFQAIAGQIDNGEDPMPFTTTRESLLNARLAYYQGKQWGEGFNDFLENVEDALKSGNLEAAETLLQFCDVTLSGRKMIKQLTLLINNPALPEDLRALYTEARTHLRAEIRDIQAGDLTSAQTHSRTAAGKLDQARGMIARIQTDQEAQRQAQLAGRGQELIDKFGCDSEVYSQFQDQCPAEQIAELDGLLNQVRSAIEAGQFGEEDIQALQDLQQLVSRMVKRTDLQNFIGGIEQLQAYLAGVAEAQNSSGATQIAALRGAAEGTAGFGPALIQLQHQAEAGGRMGASGLATLAHQQTLLQQLYALSRINTPEAKEAYNAALSELLDLNNCQSVRDLAMVLDNLVYLRQNGMLPSWLSTPQAQRNFLNQIKDHPLVQQVLSDNERGQVVQMVESIAIVIVSAATAEIGGGLIAAELGVGGGVGGFLITQAIVAPIFTAVNGGIGQELGLSEGWDSPAAFAQETAINYGMFVATGGAMRAFSLIFKAPTSVIGKIFYQSGSLLTEYMAFNGYSFALQAGEAALSDDLTLSYVFSGGNVRTVFEQNAVMLIGLKIGGFIAKPILTPLREGLLESANPRLLQDVRQYEAQTLELTQRLGDFQEQGGEMGQYLDIRQDQLTSLEKKVGLLTELREYGFATEAEVREAEAALVSARAEMEAITSQPIDEQARIEVAGPASEPSAEDTAVRTPNRINNTSYHLSALDNVETDIAYQVPPEQPELFVLGARRQIWAKGMGGAENGGLNNLVSVALDGAVRSQSTAEYGILTDGAQPNGAPIGEQGPCYVVLDGQPTTRNVGAEHQAAYLVPNSYAKGLFESAVREAMEAHIITAEQGETILSKLYTQAEYAALIHDPAFAQTEVSQSVTVNNQILFTDEHGFMTFLEDANAQFYDVQDAASEHWVALQAKAVELSDRYPGIPVYQAQALELVRARLSDLSPTERQQLIDIYGTDRPDIFFGDRYPDLDSMIGELDSLMYYLGVGLDPGFPLGREIAQIKSRLEALDYTINIRYSSSIPVSWWSNVSLDMADSFSYAVSQLRESAGYIVVDAPALETYPIEMTLTKEVNQIQTTYTKVYNIELRDLEFPADGHHSQDYFLVDVGTGEVFSHLFAKPVSGQIMGIKRITILGNLGQVYGEVVIGNQGKVVQVPTAGADDKATTSPILTNAGRKNATPKRVKP